MISVNIGTGTARGKKIGDKYITTYKLILLRKYMELGNIGAVAEELGVSRQAVHSNYDYIVEHREQLREMALEFLELDEQLDEFEKIRMKRKRKS